MIHFSVLSKLPRTSYPLLHSLVRTPLFQITSNKRNLLSPELHSSSQEFFLWHLPLSALNCISLCVYALILLSGSRLLAMWHAWGRCSADICWKHEWHTPFSWSYKLQNQQLKTFPENLVSQSSSLFKDSTLHSTYLLFIYLLTEPFVPRLLCLFSTSVEQENPVYDSSNEFMAISDFSDYRLKNLLRK